MRPLTCHRTYVPAESLESPEALIHQTADKLTALRPDLRVLFVSGYTEEDLIGRGGLAPGRAILEKPFTPTELRRRIRQLLQASG